MRFDDSGNAIGYERVLKGTCRNCGGGGRFHVVIFLMHHFGPYNYHMFEWDFQSINLALFKLL